MDDPAGQVLFDGELMADYFQLYLQDDGEDGPLPDDYSNEAISRRVMQGPRALLIHTVRNMPVPLRVVLHAARPGLDLAAFQHVVQAGFGAPSGRLLVAGLLDYAPTAARIAVPPGPLGALVTFQGLDTLSENGLDGKDCYAVHLWPDRVVPDLQVLRAYPFP